MTHQEWSELLREINRTCLAAIPHDSDPSPFGFGLSQLVDQYPQHPISRLATDAMTRKADWLGLPPATPAQIERAEHRLGIRLPTEYRRFLEVSNGFLLPGSTISSYLPIELVQPLSVNYPDVVAFWKTMLDGLGNEVPDLLEGRLESNLQISGPPNDRSDFILLDDLAENEGTELRMFRLGHVGPSEPFAMDTAMRNALAYLQWHT